MIVRYEFHSFEILCTLGFAIHPGPKPKPQENRATQHSLSHSALDCPQGIALQATRIQLYAESHDRVNDIVVVLPQRLNSLLTGNASLSHNEINILSLEASLIDLLAIVLFLLLLLRSEVGNGLLALTVVVVVVMLVVVTSVVTGGLGGGELLGGGGLGLSVQVLDLGLTEDAGYC